ncbi:MAG: N-acetylglucosamine-6-phosphate deacetylase [Terriglobales bacterium]
MIAVTADRLYTPLETVEQPMVLLEGERVVEISSRKGRELPAGVQQVNFPDSILAPGYVDIHIHGGAGHDVMETDPAALPAVEQLLARHGVTAYLPTTVTASGDHILTALDRLATAIENAEHEPARGRRARPVGIHLEGPFISFDRRGVHPPQDLLLPTLPGFERFWEAARGHIKMLTIAPELEGARALIAEAAGRGVCVSLGHSDAKLHDTRLAIEAGAKHATHTFNAMRPLGHREPGIVAAVLTDPRLSADIIADGIHLDPTIVELFLKMKGPENAVLITDATAATGMPDGRYRLGWFEVEVKNGVCMADGALAGSVLTLDRAVRNVTEFAGWGLQQALRLATLNPSRVAGLANRGKLEAGGEADIVVLSPEGEIRTTFIRGVRTEAAVGR